MRECLFDDQNTENNSAGWIFFNNYEDIETDVKRQSTKEIANALGDCDQGNFFQTPSEKRKCDSDPELYDDILLSLYKTLSDLEKTILEILLRDVSRLS